MFDDMCRATHEPCSQINKDSFMLHVTMRTFVNDEITKYWGSNIQDNQQLTSNTKYFLKQLYKDEASIFLSSLFTNFQFDVGFFIMNSQEEKSKYKNILQERISVCPCCPMMAWWRNENNLSYLFEGNDDDDDIINPKDVNKCPDKRMTVKIFIDHINAKCYAGCHFHMTIRAYIHIFHDYRFELSDVENINLTTKNIRYNYSMTIFEIIRRDNLTFSSSTTNIFDYKISSINEEIYFLNITMFEQLQKTYKVLNKANSSSSQKGLRKKFYDCFWL